MTDTLEQIRLGNICSLCEKQLTWIAPEVTNAILHEYQKYEAIALNHSRAICGECYQTLKSKYK